MDMSNSSSTTGTMSMMTPYLHFTGGDYLFFKSLQPTSHGAIAGACFVLVLFSILERVLSATRGAMEARWRQKVLTMTAARLSSSTQSYDDVGDGKAVAAVESPVNSPAPMPDRQRDSRRARIVAPFITSHDVPRGALYALQALLAYALMLAVMTFQAAYIISIVAGLGLGEMLFGRFAFSM